MQNILHIDLDYESLAPSSNKDYSKIKYQINIYDQYKSLLINQEVGPDLKSHPIDVSSLRTGLYLVELKNQYFTQVFKIQKL